MNRALLALAALLGLFAAPGAAQFGENHASASLFLRTEGDLVRAVLPVHIDDDWHLYHDDFGGQEFFAKETSVRFEGGDVAFGPVRFPEPHVFPSDVGLGEVQDIPGHEGTIVLYALGVPGPAADLGAVSAVFDGLTCAAQTCVPYRETVAAAGPGPDDLFATFPADLAGPGAAASSAGGDDAEGAAAPLERSGGPGALAGGIDPDDPVHEAVTFPDYAPQTEAPTYGVLVWLLLALLAGALLNVMPCVLPVVSIKVMSFVQQAGEDKSRILQLGLAFAAGILVVFVALAALAAFAGQSWGEQFQDSRFLIVMIGIVFAFSLSLFDVYELGVPSKVGALASGPPREGLGDAFFKGMLATVLATPCSGPFLGSTLAWAVAQPTAVVFAVFLAIGVGMAVPYVVLTANPRLLKVVPKPGPWMQTFKHLMGFLLLATVVYLMTSLRQDLLLFTVAFLVFIAMGCWVWGRWARFDQKLPARLGTLAAALLVVVGGAQLSFGWLQGLYSEGSGELDWVAFDPEQLEAAHERGQTVFVDFTADWCPNCKYNERAVYESDAIVELFREKDVLVMKADMTHDTPYTSMIERLQHSLGARSIPFMAIFPGDRPHEPFTALDIVTVAQVRAMLEATPDPVRSARADPDPDATARGR